MFTVHDSSVRRIKFLGGLFLVHFISPHLARVYHVKSMSDCAFASTSTTCSIAPIESSHRLFFVILPSSTAYET